MVEFDHGDNFDPDDQRALLVRGVVVFIIARITSIFLVIFWGMNEYADVALFSLYIFLFYFYRKSK